MNWNDKRNWREHVIVESSNSGLPSTFQMSLANKVGGMRLLSLLKDYSTFLCYFWHVYYSSKGYRAAITQTFHYYHYYLYSLSIKIEAIWCLGRRRYVNNWSLDITTWCVSVHCSNLAIMVQNYISHAYFCPNKNGSSFTYIKKVVFWCLKKCDPLDLITFCV